MHVKVSRDVLDAALKLLPLCPVNAFIDLTALDSLKNKLAKSSRLKVVGFRCEETVAKTAPITVDEEPINVSLLNLYPAKSSGLFFGYIMTATAPVYFHANFVSVVAVKETHYAECDLSFQDRYLSIVSNPSGAGIVSSNVIKLFDTGIIRLRRTKR